MSDFEIQTLFWSKLASIGQIAGAIATFMAVIVSLYFSNKDNTEEISIECGIYDNEIGKVIGVKFSNTGNQTAYLSEYSWRTGYAKFPLFFLKYSYANVDLRTTWQPNQGGNRLDPGDEKILLLKYEAWLENHLKSGLFRARKIPLIGQISNNLHCVLVTARSKRFSKKPNKEMRSIFKLYSG